MDKLRVTNISKYFAGVTALKNVNLELNKGEIHCLVGENGAGKSTLIKILAGHYKPDEGNINIDGKELIFNNPRESKSYSISVIHQELLLIPHMSVAENISLGQWVTNGIIIDRKEMVERSQKFLLKLGVDIDPTRKVKDLSTGEQQLVEIARSISHDVQVLILDEPTAALSSKEAKTLLNIVKDLKKQDIAILYVTHRLEEVFEISDKVTVFRDGKLIGTKLTEELDQNSVVKMMVGREVALEKSIKANKGKKVLEVRNLTTYGKIKDINFDLYEGEVLGLAGLVGAGRTEVLRSIFGIDKYDEGSIKLFDKEVKIKSPYHAIQEGIGLVPEDRKTQGLIMTSTIYDNITYSILKKYNSFGWLKLYKIKEIINYYVKKLSIKTPSVDRNVTTLSGGNQQKVVIARGLAINPRILLLDEPTRGVDVGAREEIHDIIQELVAQGIAVVVISSDLIELLAISNRVIVMKKGEMIKEINNEKAKATKEEVLRLATGSKRGI